MGLSVHYIRSLTTTTVHTGTGIQYLLCIAVYNCITLPLHKTCLLERAIHAPESSNTDRNWILQPFSGDISNNFTAAGSLLHRPALSVPAGLCVLPRSVHWIHFQYMQSKPPQIATGLALSFSTTSKPQRSASEHQENMRFDSNTKSAASKCAGQSERSGMKFGQQ